MSRLFEHAGKTKSSKTPKMPKVLKTSQIGQKRASKQYKNDIQKENILQNSNRPKYNSNRKNLQLEIQIKNHQH